MKELFKQKDEILKQLKELENSLDKYVSKESNAKMRNYTGANIDAHIDGTDWLLGKNKKIDELISISLWAIRRLPNESLKLYALTDLKKVVGNEHKYSEFIEMCLGEVINE